MQHIQSATSSLEREVIIRFNQAEEMFYTWHNISKDNLHLKKLYYDKAVKIFVELIKPYLKEDIYPTIVYDSENIQIVIIQALDYLSNLVEANLSIPNNYAKAIGLLEYCRKFYEHFKYDKHNTNVDFDDRDEYSEFLPYASIFETIYNIEASFIRKYNKDFIISVDQMLSTSRVYKQNLNNFQNQQKLYIREIADLSFDQMPKRIKLVKQAYQCCSDFFIGQKKTSHSISQGDDNEPPLKKMKIDYIVHHPDGFIQNLIDECFKSLGQKPDASEYSIIGLGSFSRGTATPWSDFEFAIIIQTQSVQRKQELKEYFKIFEELFLIKIINLGETPLRNLGILFLNDFRDSNTDKDWCRDQIGSNGFGLDTASRNGGKSLSGRSGHFTREKSDNNPTEEIINYKPNFKLIGTVEELINFQINKSMDGSSEVNWYKSDSGLVQALRSTILICGSQELYNIYRTALRLLGQDQQVKHETLMLFKKNLNEFALSLNTPIDNRVIDVKQNMYRIIERLLDTLSNYYGLYKEVNDSLNLWQILDILLEKKILSVEGASNLCTALTIALEYRLSVYSYYNDQNHTISVKHTVTKHINSKRYLNKEIYATQNNDLLNHFFYIIFAVQKTFYDFYQIYNQTNNFDLFLGNNSFINNSADSRGVVSSKFANYKEAMIYFEEAIQKQLVDQKIIILCSKIIRYTYSTEKNYLEKLYALLKITTDEHVIAEIHTDLIEIYIEQGLYNLALYHCESALTTSKIVESCDKQQLDSTICNLMGIIYTYLGKYNEALEYFEKVIVYTSITNHIPTTNLNIANNFFGRGILYEKLAAFDNNYADIYNKAGLSFLFRALEMMFLIYSNNPNHPQIIKSYESIANIYYQMKDIEAAAITTELVIDLINATCNKTSLIEHNVKLYYIYKSLKASSKNIYSEIYYEVAAFCQEQALQGMVNRGIHVPNTANDSLLFDRSEIIHHQSIPIYDQYQLTSMAELVVSLGASSYQQFFETTFAQNNTIPNHDDWL